MARLNTERRELDRLFDVLSQPERRRTLLHLSDVGSRDDDQLTIDELVAADHDHDHDHERERLHTELHHRHLPKLEDVGYVEWTPDGQTIRRGPRFDDIEALLALLYNNQDDLPEDLP